MVPLSQDVPFPSSVFFSPMSLLAVQTRLMCQFTHPPPRIDERLLLHSLRLLKDYVWATHLSSHLRFVSCLTWRMWERTG